MATSTFNRQNFKWFILSAILIASIGSCSKCGGRDKYQDYKKNLKTYNLKGKPKSILETTYEATDKYGELIKGSITFKNQFFFDEKGNLEQETMESEYGKFTSVYTYNNDNFLSQSQSKDSIGNITGKQIYLYDDSKHRTEYLYYSDGDLYSRTIFSDFENDKPKMEKTYGGKSEEGKLKSRYQNKYDGQGNLVQYEFFDGNDSKKSITTQSFDENGNVTQYESLSYASQEFSGYNKTTYNRNNDAIEFLVKYGSKPETRTTYEYEYDKFNNWIKKIAKSGENYVVERVITYY